MPERFLSSLILVFVCTSALIVGCSQKSTEDPRCFPVTGKVLFKGQPAKYAVVSFVPADSPEDRRPAGAIADENGEFTLMTEKRFPGAEAGEYLVAVSWQIPAKPGSSDDPELGPELLPRKYWDARTSGLKVTIEPTDNELKPFDLNP